jgi:hypothetical protein
MSMPTRQKYEPKASNVHAPLPFNPYEITKEQPQAKQAKPPSAQIMVQPTAPRKEDSSFSSPFPEAAEDSAQPYQYGQGYE